MNEQTWSEESETKRFRPTYRQLNEDEKLHADQIKSKATELSCLLQGVKDGAPSREKSLSITKLEESVMWGIKALTLCLCLAVAVARSPAYASGPLIDDHSVNADADASAKASVDSKITNAPVIVNDNTSKGGNAEAKASNTNSNKAEGGDVYRSGNSTNDLTNKQHQNQDQKQHQSIDDSGNSSNVYTNVNPRQPVSTATAAALTASPESCMGSSSIGGQGVGFGLSIGTTWENDACQARMDAKTLQALGYADAARARLCALESYRDAFAASGQPCGAPGTPVAASPPQAQQAAVVESSTPVPN